MPPDARSLADEWLAMARSDLVAAQSLIGDPALPRQASYCAQQAAEKSVKAVLTALNRPFPKTHDLVELMALLPNTHPLCDLDVDWPGLTEWAVRGRYPGTGPAAMQDEARCAAAAAALVITAVEGWLVQRP